MENKRPYEDLKFYKDICEIRKFIFEITKRFEKINLRLVSQMRDAARSAKQNIRESYRKGTLGEFLHGIKISQGSLEELSGDMEDCLQDRQITQDEFDRFEKLYHSASYMSTQYLKAMYKVENAGTWKVPGNHLRLKKQPKGTSRNLKKP
ncbi:MAG: four helix bundle protein [Candidatus Omnitrophota bacterium]